MLSKRNVHAGRPVWDELDPRSLATEDNLRQSPAPMKALKSFAVRASLPEPLAPLHAIATNLRWSWDPRAVELFRWVDPDAWERAAHDPVQMLGLVSRDRYHELTEDQPFMSFLSSVDQGLRRYLEEPRLYQSKGARTHWNGWRTSRLSSESARLCPPTRAALAFLRETTSRRRAISVCPWSGWVCCTGKAISGRP